MGPYKRTAQGIRSRKHIQLGVVLAVLLAIVASPPKAEEITLTQVKVRNEEDRPVRSEIFRIPPTVPEKSLPLDETDDQGELKLSFVCQQGTRIQARPHSAAYMFSKKAYCRSTLSLRVDTIKVWAQLQQNLDKAREAEDYATTVLIANELANMETRDGKGIAGVEAEILAIVYAGEAFKVTNGVAFNRELGRAVMARTLKAKVREFQNQNGLEETGNIDYNTVSTLAGTSSGAVRHFVYEPFR